MLGEPLDAPSQGGAFRDRLRAGLLACRSHWRYAALFSAGFNLLFLVPMLYLLQVYDRVVPTRGGLTLLFLTLFLIVAVVAMGVLDYARGRLLVRASIRLDRMLADPLLQLAYARAPGSSEARRLMREFDTLRRAMSGSAILALFDAPWTPLYILICFIIHPAIGFLALFGAGLLLGLTWLNHRRTSAPLEEANSAAAAAYASHDRTLTDAGVVRALGMRNALVARQIGERARMIGQQAIASFAGSSIGAASKALRLLLQSLALGLGALLAINELVTPGAIFASMFLVGRALSPIDRLVGAWRQMVDARQAWRIINRSAEGETPLDEHTALPAPTGRLALKGVSLDPGHGERPILDDIDLEIAAGEAVAIIGPSGAGKTSLLSLIAGALEPDAGTIRFDGADRRDWDSEALARFIGFMPQHPTLMAGSVRDNVARFSQGEGVERERIDAEVVEAAKKAGAHELILNLSDGYDHKLGLGGSGLSMGQAQRIALARALYEDPPYLLLDEPNAHLDADGDLQLIEALNDAKEAGTTLVIVVHRLSVLPVLDRIVLLRDGRIELDGPKDEVLARIGHGQPRVTRHHVKMGGDK
ncbi:type I secretion system permease/ATPase [Sphingomicrobium aestuariivivum]|uniref:type I secretion system permease/ATPase n=1 Tax=Sphingomicrobium aestuariivivum TaxID=1582356 RepID=UPI001FD68D48|nr:type I secretion system permease/ATPase [Sphingomicrobium aestuariivivum]MCJ8189825.1 type I secretion system permease/ATPase [Sphingomicrobium aestuariivivum]